MKLNLISIINFTTSKKILKKRKFGLLRFVAF